MRLSIAGVCGVLLSCSGAPVPAASADKEGRADVPGAHVVVLGSGTPVADPDRAGPSTAIVVGDVGLVFDAGANVLRRLEAASGRHPALAPERVTRVFLTHLHSDHVLGLDELLAGAWVLGRDTPLQIWGPPGTRELVDGLRAAYADDRRVRTEGLEGLEDRGSEVAVREVSPGLVLRSPGRDGVEVRAFAVPHGSWSTAYGYVVEAGGRRIVISGDTAASEAVVEACDGCDVLVHEVCSGAGLRRLGEGARAYHGSFHTNARELGGLALRARPDRLVLTHILFFGESEASIAAEVREGGYEGELFVAWDLAGY